MQQFKRIKCKLNFLQLKELLTFSFLLLHEFFILFRVPVFRESLNFTLVEQTFEQLNRLIKVLFGNLDI